MLFVSSVQKWIVKMFGSISTATSRSILFCRTPHRKKLGFQLWQLLPKHIYMITIVIYLNWIFIDSIVSEIFLLLILRILLGVLNIYWLLKCRIICKLDRILFINFKYNQWCNCIVPSKRLSNGYMNKSSSLNTKPPPRQGIL